MPLTFGSLFAGIGGIDLGLERAGMQCAWQCEIDDYAQRVLAKHWPDVPKFRDVRSVGAHNLSRVDVIAGGFPCQDISNAGKQAGIGGSRSGLWSEYERIVRELRPRYVLVENVAALLVRGMGTVLGDLAALGYDAEWQCIPAAAIGAPHIRDRIFILAYANSAERWQSAQGWHESDGANARRQEAPSRFTACGSDGRAASMANTDGIGGRAGAEQSPRGRIFDGAEISHSSWWATEPTICRVVNGLPDRTHRLKGLGNAVVPQVAEFIGRMIVEHASA